MHRVEHEEVSARSANRNDLVAISSVFKWALSREGRTKLPSFHGKDNPAHGVSLTEEKRIIRREKSYWLGE